MYMCAWVNLRMPCEWRQGLHSFHHLVRGPHDMTGEQLCINADAILWICCTALWVLHLEFEDKCSGLICLLHGRTRWTLMLSLSFLPQQPRVCSTRRRTALRWEASSQRRRCLVTCISLWERSVSETQKWLYAFCTLNIIIHGQSLQQWAPILGFLRLEPSRCSCDIAADSHSQLK